MSSSTPKPTSAKSFISPQLHLNNALSKFVRKLDSYSFEQDDPVFEKSTDTSGEVQKDESLNLGKQKQQTTVTQQPDKLRKTLEVPVPAEVTARTNRLISVPNESTNQNEGITGEKPAQQQQPHQEDTCDNPIQQQQPQQQSSANFPPNFPSTVSADKSTVQLRFGRFYFNMASG